MLEVKTISKRFANFAIDSISFQVENGDYFVLLGQSGSGKSVILQLIAGIIQPDSGEIYMNGKNITNEKIQKRGAGYLFQDYALFPHLRVKENISYPLKNYGISGVEAQKQVEQIAQACEIFHLLNKFPDVLSGGEKQRVALARSLIVKPKILLLDEPLSAIDTQLKAQIRHLLRKINQEGLTIVHITHDQDEAIALANKVAVIQNGELLQTGSIDEVFQHPKSEYVASFLGIKNFFRCKILNADDKKAILFQSEISIFLETDNNEGEGFVIIDASSVYLSDNEPEGSARNRYVGKVFEIIPYKSGFEVFVDVGIKICCLISKTSFTNFQLYEGKNIWVSFKSNSVRFVKI